MQKFKSNLSLRIILLPLSWVYGLAIFIRNKAFDLNLLKSKSYVIPTISVGNLTVGGTGKTPHVELLIESLVKKYQVAVLSRGYRRKTKGYVLAKKDATPDSIGDEPYQMFSKYKGITVAVSEKRTLGIERLMQRKKKVDVIVLDDAFQHRYVKPGLSILLIDYNRPVFKDFLLPAGNLREGFNGRKRADVVIVTKCPGNLENDDILAWREKLKLSSGQSLFFTKVNYINPRKVFGNTDLDFDLKVLKQEEVKVLLVTGIANPVPIQDYLKQKGIKAKLKSFPDHHFFTKGDIKNIRQEFKNLSGRKKIILTTEKDAVRLKQFKKFPRSIKHKVYALPINIEILNGKMDEFKQLIMNYVGSNQ